MNVDREVNEQRRMLDIAGRESHKSMMKIRAVENSY
jgi:hypothetical protein